jgi:hypothetical protein
MYHVHLIAVVSYCSGLAHAQVVIVFGFIELQLFCYSSDL